MDFGRNRITEQATELQRRMDSGVKPDGTPIGDLTALRKSMKLEPGELHAYQDAQAEAYLRGVLTQAEATTVYNALGEGTSWKTRDLALQVTVTQVMAELLPILKRMRDADAVHGSVKR